MTAHETLPFLRIPPFPHAKVGALSRPAKEGDAVLDGDADLVAALVRARVGGSYWATQPVLPDPPYIVVAIADPKLRKQTLAALGDEQPIVCCVQSSSGALLQPDHLVVSGLVDPWHLVAGASRVIVDADDELALVARLAGVGLQCVGLGRFLKLASGGPDALCDAVRRHLLDGLHYVDPFTGADISALDAVALCLFWRTLIDSNRDIAGAFGLAFWKRATVAPLLWGGHSQVAFDPPAGRVASGQSVAVWKSRTSPSTLAALQAGNAHLIEVEDGFIRSTGLGADCVPPLSIIVDRLGVYFDPANPSDLERLLQEAEFTPDLRDRARRLRELIVRSGISKYGVGTETLIRRNDGRRYILVPGQVEDDRSVMSGGGDVRTNLELLERTRATDPDATIIYKPHPDVEAGHRTGAIADDDCLRFADEITRSAPISSLIDLVDEVHVNTSLAGFEALLRGKPVTTHGVPFYAGWGLTRDLGLVPARRTARRTLDELVAAALLLYPRYLDPVTGLPCPAEVLIKRLSEGGIGQKQDGTLVRLRRLQGRGRQMLSKIWTR